MTTTPTLPCYQLSEREVVHIQARLADRWDSGRLWAMTHRLPKQLHEYLYDTAHDARAGALVVPGFPVDDVEIGPTPTDWRDALGRTSTVIHERFLLTLASALGAVFSFPALQEGRLVQDLLPMPGHEETKSGNSSRSLLDLHTEDAFSAHRCDYLGLMCLRNTDLVPTSYAEPDLERIPEELVDVLFQRRFTIRADDTHNHQGGLDPIALLWGDRNRPFLRIDDQFTDPLPGDEPARAALEALVAALYSAEQDITLRPGDVVFIDNHLAAHGRRPFTARYDGTDRWIKRVSITRSAACRGAALGAKKPWAQHHTVVDSALVAGSTRTFAP
jgi:L-asparagine oxygenase